MPKRQYGNLMPLRQHISVNSGQYDALYGSKVFHVDAWLYQTPDDTIYLLIESRIAGQQLIDRRVYRAQPDALIQVGDKPDLEATGIQRHINSAWSRKNAPWLAALHWKRIQRDVRLPRVGFNRISVKLWYVWHDPALADPMEGLTNWYDATGYSENAPLIGGEAPSPKAYHKARMLAGLARAEKASGWTAKQRSLLRTLDKLLKPNTRNK